MDMYNCLNRFAAESLFDASAAMLSQLKIKFTPKTREPIPFRDMYLRTLRQMPKALENAYAKVADCYFVGAIDEDSLAGRDSSFEIGERTDEISEGKYCSMLVFAVDIKPDERLARSEIATLTRGFNRLATALPVILLCATATAFLSPPLNAPNIHKRGATAKNSARSPYCVT